MWSGHNRTPILNLQQVRLPANDLQETKPTNIAAWMGTHPLAAELFPAMIVRQDRKSPFFIRAVDPQQVD